MDRLIAYDAIQRAYRFEETSNRNRPCLFTQNCVVDTAMSKLQHNKETKQNYHSEVKEQSALTRESE